MNPKKPTIIVKEEIYKKAIETWGENLQLGMLIEECAELIKAVNKFWRKKDYDSINSLAEECADVEIMIEQLKIMNKDVFCKKVDDFKEVKLIKLRNLLFDNNQVSKNDNHRR